MQKAVKFGILTLAEYSKDEIFEKNLLALLPYYFMRYEQSLPELCRDEETSHVLLEELIDIRTRLEQTVGEEKGLIYAELISHIRKIDNHLFRKHAETRERMEAITMGGQVYETLAMQLLRQDHAEGKLEGKFELVNNMVNASICSFEKACEVAEITPDEYEQIKAQLVTQPQKA